MAGDARLVISDASYARAAPRRTRVWFFRALKVSMSWGDIRALAGAGWLDERISVLRITDAAKAGEAGYPEDLARAIASVRTDLDRFTDGEIAVLENHGYQNAERLAKSSLKDLVSKSSDMAIPHPVMLDERAAWLALCGSGRRLAKFRPVARLAQRWRWHRDVGAAA
jgi:hypothetical protein